MTAIETKYASQMEAARGNGRDAMKSLMDAKMAEVSSVLSADQLMQYKTAIQEMREERTGGRGR